MLEMVMNSSVSCRRKVVFCLATVGWNGSPEAASREGSSTRACW